MLQKMFLYKGEMTIFALSINIQKKERYCNLLIPKEIILKILLLISMRCTRPNFSIGEHLVALELGYLINELA